MKKIIIIILAMFAMTNIQAQGVNRGTYGNMSPFTRTNMANISGTTGTAVAKLYGKDTLTNGDTGYAYIWVGQGFSGAVELVTTVLTGTVATTANVVYGVNNGGRPLTAAGVLAAVAGTPGTNAYALTGNTTYCAGCVGASSTTVPGTSKKYTWQFPYNGGLLFDNIIIKTVQTGTVTATYTGNLTTQY